MAFLRIIIISVALWVKLSVAAPDCNTNTCNCFPGDYYEYQCPSEDGVIVHVPDHNRTDFPEGKTLKIDCVTSHDALNISILPTISVGSIDYLQMRKCLLSPSDFTQLLVRFGISSVKQLEITHLDMSDITPNKDYFKGLDNLTILVYQNNLMHLNGNVFDHTPNLMYIDLKYNQLLELSPNIFQNTRSLQFLDLATNQLVDLPVGLFGNLTQLTKLHLWRNKLTFIRNSTFDGLINLTSLELSSNKIERIDEYGFATLAKLVDLSLSGNNLKNISYKLFHGNLLLENIRLGRNRNLQLPDYLLSNLPKLMTVTLDQCSLIDIPEHLFEHSTNLEIINFEGNQLSQLPLGLFNGLENLKELNLKKNQLNRLENIMLTPLKKLETLHLENNRLTIIDENFLSKLNKLKHVYFDMNQITTIHTQAFKDNKNLIKISLSSNKYNYSLDSGSPFNPCTDLEELNLSHNLITSFNGDDNLSKVQLRVLDLSHNQITSISLQSLQIVSKEVKFNFANNHITTITDFAHLAFYDGGHSVILLDNNPINCDCNSYDLVKYFQDEWNLNLKKIISIQVKNLQCTEPQVFRNRSVDKLTTSMLYCPLSEIIDNYTGCPNSCQCIWRPYDKSINMDCSNKNLTQIPRFILPNFNKHNQTIVDLRYNFIKQGPNSDLMSMGYGNVSKLYLSHNVIEDITWLPPNFEVVKLDHNKLQKLDYSLLQMMDNMNFSKITFHDNPWTCNCEAENFTNFLQEHPSLQVDYSQIKCKNNDKLLVSMNHQDLCQPHIKLYLSLGIIATLFICTLLTIYALYWRYHQEIKVWCYAHNICLRWVTEEELDKDKLYDAFISYSHKDEDFVVENLLPVLETGPKPYKLCLHYRNWIPGEFIAKQVANSVQDSRRTLVILSPDFLESIWGKMEFRTAHTQAMSEGRVRVIIVLYGDVDVDALDDELKAYLKTNTYVKWGDPWFWDKLRYALPHSKIKLPNSQKHANIMSTIDDKFTLVSSPAIDATNPGSTPPVLSLKQDPLNFKGTLVTPPTENGAIEVKVM